MLYIHYSFDALRLGGLAMRAIDDGGSFDALLDSGEVAHVDMASAVDHRGETPSRLASISVFATSLTSILNTLSSGAGTWLVEYTDAGFYSISYSGGAFSIDFRAATIGTGGPRLAAALGYAPTVLASAGSALSSTVRPYYVIIPSAMGRSKLTPDRYDAGIATDARTDGGVYGQTSVARSAVLKEWTQVGEAETSIGDVAYDEPGTPVHAYRATAAVPWSYQHAWDHALTYKCAIRVHDGNPSTPPEVLEMRADGLSFAPTYTGSDDFAMYSVEYRTRLLGRVIS